LEKDNPEMKRKFPLLFLLLLLALFTGCFRDVLSWSPDGRYLSLIEPKDGRLWIWDSKTDQSAIAIPTTGTATAAFLPKRWFAGQEMLVGKSTRKSGSSRGTMFQSSDIDLSIFNMKTEEAHLVVPNMGSGYVNYDINRKGWVYYVLEGKEDKSDQKKYALWGYDIRKHNFRLIYQSNTEMHYPCSDAHGRILMATGNEDREQFMVVDADNGSTHSLASFATPFALPMWANKGKSVLYLVTDKDPENAGKEMETMTLCRLDLETKTTESLLSQISPFCRVQVTKDEKWAVATCKIEHKERSFMARVNLKGKPAVEYLTPKDGAALFGTLSPNGNYLAYMEGLDTGGLEKVVVKDLTTNAEKIIWHAKKN
jgi:Tol biopolymer transport system component